MADGSRCFTCPRSQMSGAFKHILTATALGNVSVLTQWINDGGDPNARTIDGHTLPSVAAIFCRLDSMTVLVERGARVDVADGDGWTPLIEAVVFQPGIESNDDHRVRRRELVDLLLTHGASVDRRTADGMTPLMLAAAQGHMDIIRLLLKRGAVLTLTDGAGRNAEAAAERRSRHDAAELLAEVRLSGGTWKRYISEPRRDLVVLRVLCSRGRAMLSSNEGRLVGPSQGGALARLFPAPPGRTRSQKKRRTRGPHLPDELFWRVLQFWRSERDFPEEPEEFAAGYGDDMVDIQFHDEEFHGWLDRRPGGMRNFVPRAMFLLPLDVRLDELVALRVFDLLHGRRDFLRGEDEPAHPRGPEPPRAPVRADPGRQVRVAFVLERLGLAVVARTQERVLHPRGART